MMSLEENIERRLAEIGELAIEFPFILLGVKSIEMKTSERKLGDLTLATVYYRDYDDGSYSSQDRVSLLLLPEKKMIFTSEIQNWDRNVREKVCNVALSEKKVAFELWRYNPSEPYSMPFSSHYLVSRKVHVVDIDGCNHRVVEDITLKEEESPVKITFREVPKKQIAMQPGWRDDGLFEFMFRDCRTDMYARVTYGSSSRSIGEPLSPLYRCIAVLDDSNKIARYEVEKA